jgi:hypothetical protein
MTTRVEQKASAHSHVHKILRDLNLQRATQQILLWYCCLYLEINYQGTGYLLFYGWPFLASIHRFNTDAFGNPNCNGLALDR